MTFSNFEIEGTNTALFLQFVPQFDFQPTPGVIKRRPVVTAVTSPDNYDLLKTNKQKHILHLHAITLHPSFGGVVVEQDLNEG